MPEVLGPLEVNSRTQLYTIEANTWCLGPTLNFQIILLIFIEQFAMLPWVLKTTPRGRYDDVHLSVSELPRLHRQIRSKALLFPSQIPRTPALTHHARHSEDSISFPFKLHCFLIPLKRLLETWDHSIACKCLGLFTLVYFSGEKG